MHIACSDSKPCRNVNNFESALLSCPRKEIYETICWKAYGRLRTSTLSPVSWHPKKLA